MRPPIRPAPIQLSNQSPERKPGGVLSIIEVRHLHTVIVLADELNFTRAAHRLRISQPALSRQITDLEEWHGFRVVYPR